MRVTRRRLRRQIRNNITEASEARLLSETVSALADIEAGASDAKQAFESGVKRGTSEVTSPSFLGGVADFFATLGITDPCDYVEKNIDELSSDKEKLGAALDEMQKAQDAKDANNALSTVTQILGTLGVGSLAYFLLNNKMNVVNAFDNTMGSPVKGIGRGVGDVFMGMFESDHIGIYDSMLTEDALELYGAHMTSKQRDYALDRVHSDSKGSRSDTLNKTLDSLQKRKGLALDKAKTYIKAGTPNWKREYMSAPSYDPNLKLAPTARNTPLDPHGLSQKIHPIFKNKNIDPEVARMAKELVWDQLQLDDQGRIKIPMQTDTSALGKVMGFATGNPANDRFTAGGSGMNPSGGASSGPVDSSPLAQLKHKDVQRQHALEQYPGGKEALALAVTAGLGAVESGEIDWSKAVATGGEAKFKPGEVSSEDMRHKARLQLIGTLGRGANTSELGKEIGQTEKSSTIADKAQALTMSLDPGEPREYDEILKDISRGFDPEGEAVDQGSSGLSRTAIDDIDVKPGEKSTYSQVYGTHRAQSVAQAKIDDRIHWNKGWWGRAGMVMVAIAAVLFIYQALLNFAPGVLCSIKEFISHVGSKIASGIRWVYSNVIKTFFSLIKDISSRAWDAIKSYFVDEESPLPMEESYHIIKEWNDLNDAVFVFGSRSLSIL